MLSERVFSIWFVALVLGCLVAGVVEAAGYGSTGSKPGPAPTPRREVVEVEQSVKVAPNGNTVVRESVEVDGNGSTVVRESVEVGPAKGAGVAAVPGDQPPRLLSQYRDANRECRQTKQAARLGHRAYRNARRAGAAATEQAAVEASRDAYQAAK